MKPYRLINPIIGGSVSVESAKETPLAAAVDIYDRLSSHFINDIKHLRISIMGGGGDSATNVHTFDIRESIKGGNKVKYDITNVTARTALNEKALSNITKYFTSKGGARRSYSSSSSSSESSSDDSSSDSSSDSSTETFVADMIRTSRRRRRRIVDRTHPIYSWSYVPELYFEYSAPITVPVFSYPLCVSTDIVCNSKYLVLS